MIDLKSLASYETKRFIPSGLERVELRYLNKGLFTDWETRSRTLDYADNPCKEIPQYSVPEVGFICPEHDMQVLLHFVHEVRLVTRVTGTFNYTGNHGFSNTSGQDCVGFLLYSHWIGDIDLNLWRVKEDLNSYVKLNLFGNFPSTDDLGMKLTEAVYTLLTLDRGKVESVELRVTHNEGQDIIRYPF